MKIVFLRHTQVIIEPGIVYGQTNVKLAKSFNNELKQIKKMLNPFCFEQIYSSPLLRCNRLAIELAKKRSITLDDRLMELNFGNWEGRSWDYIYQTSPEWFDNFLTQACPNGESNMDLINRCKDFLTDIKKKHKTGHILVVSHAGPIRAMLAIIDNINPENSFEIKVNYGEIITRKITQ